jgi:putative copper resistance protein D
MIWMGSLYPLWKSCDYLETPLLKQLMTRFGEIASFAVPVLILMGGLMLWVLLPSLSALYQTPYGKLVSFKLFSVVLMLMLAARHKWFLVPNLESQGNVLKLKRSIQCEAVLGCMILVVTAYFSSSVGLH